MYSVCSETKQKTLCDCLVFFLYVSSFLCYNTDSRQFYLTNEKGEFILGIALTAIGAYVFLTHITVTSFSFYMFRGVNTPAVLLLAMCVCFVVVVAKPNLITKWLLGIFSLLFIVSIILSLHFIFHGMNAFVLLLVLATFCGGLGLILRACIGVKKYDTDKEKHSYDKYL